MLFNSVEYLFFFIVVSAIYFVTPSKYKWVHLLLASLYFYSCWRLDYTILLIGTIFLSYWSALKIGQYSSSKKKGRYLIFGLIVNFGQLFVFKYYNFSIDNVNSLFGHFNIFLSLPYLKWLLPIGISFHTFQITSYLFDVNKGKVKPEEHLGIFSLFVCFFPQLVAGPIEKASHLLPQLNNAPKFKSTNITVGLQLMLWGAFKKIVVADNLSKYVAIVFDDLTLFSIAPIVLSLFFFTFQVYCDFSGYSDIARGTAKVLGYDMVNNFDKPFFSKSVSEFWRKWHISLYVWFTDYVYTPLVIRIRNLEKWAPILGVIILFTCSGLWHGAGWTFLCYGALHGLYISIEILTKKRRKKLKGFIGEFVFNQFAILITFSLVSITFLFFRAKNFAQVTSALSTIFAFNLDDLGINIHYSIGRFSIALNFVFIFVLLILEYLDLKSNLFAKFYNSAIWLRWPVYLMAIWVIILMGNLEQQEFIYFQF
jgi:alginate O-acetyltransferase complex protein AlgI